MSTRTKNRLSKATLYATLSALKRFFVWLAGQPGYRSRISYADAEYFNLSAKETRVAKTHRDERVPTLEQIRHVISMMPAATEIERRDRALIAFTILTGARDGATASLKLKHIDVDQSGVDQDAREVKTKFSKSFATWFFPVGDDIRQVVVDWVTYLRQEKLWGLDDPLFPATKIVSATVAISRHRGSTANLGAAPGPSGRFLRTPLRLPVCLTSTRIASARRWPFSVVKSASLPRSTKPGPRTSDMRMSSRRFRATATLHVIVRPRLFVPSGSRRVQNGLATSRMKAGFLPDPHAVV
jgi:hypothetical protein